MRVAITFKKKSLFQKLSFLIIIIIALIVLVGGTTNGNGNVFARNPTTGIYGPVCDDLWSLTDVGTFQLD